MLPVSIDGDNTLRTGDIFEYIGKGSFQCSALPFIDAVVQHRTLGIFLGLCKPLPMISITPIVYNDYIPKTALHQPGHHTAELCVRVQGREHDHQRIAAIAGECIHYSTETALMPLLSQQTISLLVMVSSTVLYWA